MASYKKGRPVGPEEYGCFAAAVEAVGLKPRDCGHDHWQIAGGVALVNYWPATGRVYVDRSPRSFPGTSIDAINRAGGDCDQPATAPAASGRPERPGKAERAANGPAGVTEADVIVHCDASCDGNGVGVIGYIAYRRQDGGTVREHVQLTKQGKVTQAEVQAVMLARNHLRGVPGVIVFCTDNASACSKTGARKIKSGKNRAHRLVIAELRKHTKPRKSHETVQPPQESYEPPTRRTAAP